ncbi:hypothetical protein MYAM1_001577 [Malassezia yamatoensis]|uniref:H/ACA ribonucleoprotein complex non-core subunit NAF1 n=1 Tax=Malassezia yamatoensis TaxID=253288 RepID=A0AAJ5YYJ9_9BASI|nr:hypothetical protein MYAM1_001577 [Malassezia yamatoensis]
MGAELSRLRGQQRSTSVADSRREESELDAQSEADGPSNKGPEHIGTPSCYDSQDDPSVAFPSSATGSLQEVALPSAGAESDGQTPISLTELRERAQKLRAELRQETVQLDQAIRTELQTAGVLTEATSEASEDHQSSSSSSSGSEDQQQDSQQSESDEDQSDTDHVCAKEDQDTLEDNVIPQTKHEVLDEEIEVPAIRQVSTEDLAFLHPIGTVHSIVDNVILVAQKEKPVQADFSQPVTFDVLDSGSLLALQDGYVLGLVYETFGSVDLPFYSIRVPSSETIDRDKIHVGQSVYYLPSSSTYVLARSIRTKGSDASNVWDEEVGADEAEFSDDEQEAISKKQAKQQRRANQPNANDQPSELDPVEASLGPLGGFASNAPPAARGRKRRDRGRRDHHPNAPDTKRKRFPAYQSNASAPHINPRFAEQWMQSGPPFGMLPGMLPSMPPFSSNFGMPPMDTTHATNFAGTYSPHHAQIDPSHTESYNPHIPDVGRRQDYSSQPTDNIPKP